MLSVPQCTIIGFSFSFQSAASLPMLLRIRTKKNVRARALQCFGSQNQRVAINCGMDHAFDNTLAQLIAIYPLKVIRKKSFDFILGIHSFVPKIRRLIQYTRCLGTSFHQYISIGSISHLREHAAT